MEVVGRTEEGRILAYMIYYAAAKTQNTFLLVKVVGPTVKMTIKSSGHVYKSFLSQLGWPTSCKREDSYTSDQEIGVLSLIYFALSDFLKPTSKNVF